MEYRGMSPCAIDEVGAIPNPYYSDVHHKTSGSKDAAGQLTIPTFSADGGHEELHGVSPGRKNPRGLHNRQVLALNHNAVVYSSLALQAAGMPIRVPSSCSTTGANGRARSATPSAARPPAGAPPTRACTPASDRRPRTTPGSRSARHRGDAPAWTLMYAMPLGMGVGSDPESQGSQDGASVHPGGGGGGGAFHHGPHLERSASKNLGHSVFLTESGWDKRITPKCRLTAEKAEKQTRLTMRRNAIVAYGQKRLQLITAVRSMSLWHPRYMRTLNRINDDVPATLKGKVVHVGEGEPLPGWQVQQYADDTGLDEKIVASYWTAFHRYDMDEGGFVDPDKARDALADVGLEARNREEKQGLAEIIKDCDISGDGHLAFFEFLVLQKEVRLRMKGIRQKLVTDLFANGRPVLQEKVAVTDLLVHVRGYAELSPHTPEELATFHAIAAEHDADADGKVTLAEFQEMAEDVRERFSTIRREAERAIEKEYNIAPALFQEVRSDLRLYHEIFKRYDHNETDTLPAKSLLMFFMDIGLILPKPPNSYDYKDAALRSMVATAHADYPSGIGLNDLLALILSMRSQCKLLSQESLRQKFLACDKDKSGDVTMREMYTCLEELDMLPHSREEQLLIRRVLEDLDYEGSGSFQFPDFQDFFQRLVEQNQQVDRERVRLAAVGIGFTDQQFQVMLGAYYRMEHDDKGRITRLAVAQYLSKMAREPLPKMPPIDEPRMRNYQRQAHKSPTIPADVLQFMRTIRYVAPDPEYEQVLSAHLVQDGLVDASRYNGSDVEQTRLRIQERSGLLDPEVAASLGRTRSKITTG